jgi:hypothetical protein
MNTQVATWPNDTFQSDSPLPVKSATGYGRTVIQSATLESPFENGAVILFTAFFAAELFAVVAGIGLILVSLAKLAL